MVLGAESLEIIIKLQRELARFEHNMIARPRPLPYDVTEAFTLTDGGTPDTFPEIYTLIARRGTYDFGDSPNMGQIISLSLELMSVNDTYLLEFYRSADDKKFTPLGAVRFRRGAAAARTLAINRPIRPENVDVYSLYGRLKSAMGGNSVTFSLVIERYLPLTELIPLTKGIWPWG